MCQQVEILSNETSFEALLPVILLTAKRAFRDVRCPQTRDDAVAEVVAIAWVGFRMKPDRFDRPEATRRFACDCAEAVRAGCRFADAAGD